MKIRCEQNSIRLRLRRSELVQLRVEKWIETAIHFPDGKTFTWELLLDEGLPEIAARFDNSKVQIRVPADMAHRWMDAQEVSIERFQPLGAGAALHVLIEKDFPCKDRPGEDKSDFFSELMEEGPVNC